MHQGVKTRQAFGHRQQWIMFLRASAVSQKTPDWLRIGRFRGTSLHTATGLALPSYWKLSEHLQQVNADVLLQAAQVPDFLYALSPAARRSGVAIVTCLEIINCRKRSQRAQKETHFFTLARALPATQSSRHSPSDAMRFIWPVQTGVTDGVTSWLIRPYPS